MWGEENNMMEQSLLETYSSCSCKKTLINMELPLFIIYFTIITPVTLVTSYDLYNIKSQIHT